MLLRLLTGLPAVALQNALAAPVEATRRIAPPATDTARMVAELVSAGARGVASGAAAVSATALRVGRVARNAVTPQVGYWRAGSRMHLALRQHPDAHESTVERLEAACEKVAVELAEHPDVLIAYWDGGLGRLVMETTEGAVDEQLVDRVSNSPPNTGWCTSPTRRWNTRTRVQPGACAPMLSPWRATRRASPPPSRRERPF